MRCPCQMVGGHQIDTQMGVARAWGSRAAVRAENHSMGSQDSPAKCQDGSLVTLGDLLRLFIWGGVGLLCHHPRGQAPESSGASPCDTR